MNSRVHLIPSLSFAKQGVEIYAILVNSHIVNGSKTPLAAPSTPIPETKGNILYCQYRWLVT